VSLPTSPTKKTLEELEEENALLRGFFQIIEMAAGRALRDIPLPLEAMVAFERILTEAREGQMYHPPNKASQPHNIYSAH
jgi:hypothetical protein